MHTTIQNCYNYTNQDAHIKIFACDKWQQTKTSSPCCDLLPDWDIADACKTEVAVELIGSWLEPTMFGEFESFPLT